MTLFNWAAAAVVGARVAEQVYDSVQTLLIAVPVLMAPIIAHYFSDFVSAVYHKRTDSYSSEEDPRTTEFRHHHEYPGNLNHTGYFDNLASVSGVVAIPFAMMAADRFFW